MMPGGVTFLQILSIKAAKSRVANDCGESQRYHVRTAQLVGTKFPRTIQDQVAFLPSIVDVELDRDHNAAINIKHRAVGHSVLKAQATPDGIPGVTEKPALYA